MRKNNAAKGRQVPQEDSDCSEDSRVNSQENSSPANKKPRTQEPNVGADVDHNSSLVPPAVNSETQMERLRREVHEEVKKEIEKIRQEIRDEAIRETEAKRQARMREIVQCVVCLRVPPRYLVPREEKIFQCQNGHIICNDCSSKIGAQCPSCRTAINKLTGDKKIRNLAVEQIIESLDCYNCQNLDCEFSGNFCEMALHKKKCEYRLVQCPDGGYYSHYGGCLWNYDCPRDIPFHSLLDHWFKPGYDREYNFNLTIDEPSYTNITFWMENEGWMGIHEKRWGREWNCEVLHCNDHVFLFKALVYQKMFYSFMFLLGDEEKAKKFTVTLAIPKGSRSIQGRIYPIDATIRDIIKKQDGDGVLKYNLDEDEEESLFEDKDYWGESGKELFVGVKICTRGQ